MFAYETKKAVPVCTKITYKVQLCCYMGIRTKELASINRHFLQINNLIIFEKKTSYV